MFTRQIKSLASILVALNAVSSWSSIFGARVHAQIVSDQWMALRAVSLLGIVKSSLLGAVNHVGFLVASLKMIRVAARWIVARVKDGYSGINWNPEVVSSRDAMNSNTNRVSRDHAVSIGILSSLPNPATILSFFNPQKYPVHGLHCNRLIVQLCLLFFAAAAFGQIPFPGPGRASVGGSGDTYTGKSCVNNVSGSTNPVTCTWSSSPASGENVYCGVQNSGGGTGEAVTDSAANSYTFVGGGMHDVSGGGGPFVGIFYFANPGAITTTSFSTSGSTRISIACLAFTSADSTPADGSSTTNRTTGTSASTTVSPAASSGVLFAVIMTSNDDSGITLTAGSGFTKLLDTDIDFTGRVAVEYKMFVASGSNTCDFSWNNTDTGLVFCQAFN